MQEEVDAAPKHDEKYRDLQHDYDDTRTLNSFPTTMYVFCSPHSTCTQVSFYPLMIAMTSYVYSCVWVCILKVSLSMGENEEEYKIKIQTFCAILASLTNLHVKIDFSGR